MTFKQKSCKMCKAKFTPSQPLQMVCGHRCALDYSRGKMKATKKKEIKEAKEKLKTKSEYLKDLQMVFNKFIRLRDKDLPCISCGTTANIKYDAGHYIAVSESPALRFNENNVHKQCSNYCNKNKHGNYHAYRFWLIEKIGIEEVEVLESSRHIPLKLSIEDIKEQIIIYKNKVKDLEN